MNDNTLNNQNQQLTNSQMQQSQAAGVQNQQLQDNTNMQQSMDDPKLKLDQNTNNLVNNNLNDVTTPKMDLNNNDKNDNEVQGDMAVTKRDVENVVSSWTGIPISKLTEDESAKLLELEKRVHLRLIDQEEAVVKVSEAVRRGRIGLASGQRPIASFIFLGPSGTGKTELAKTLAEILFGRDDAMVRLDMSEYMEKHEVAKLIGAPPGYVGYEEGGQLTEAVRAKPYSIVLLDEVEKAHPDVFNILLQLLEDGRLTDNKGNTISFKNTIVICTSNIGSGIITEKLGETDIKEKKTQAQYEKQYAELNTIVSNELRKFFRPELLNRFDDIVIFKPLRREDMVGIAKLGIEKTAKLLLEQGFTVQITDRALKKLAQEGYDPMYGARPLRRLIQGSIENPVALEIIGKKLTTGDTILIDYKGATNEFSFTKGIPVSVSESTDKNTIPSQNNPLNPEVNGMQTQQPTANPMQQVPGVEQLQPEVPQQMYYGQEVVSNTQTTNPQVQQVVPSTPFDPMSVLGNTEQAPADTNTQFNGVLDTNQPNYPMQPPTTGTFMAGGTTQQDTVLNTGRFQQGAANETPALSVLQDGQLNSSGLEVLNES